MPRLRRQFAQHPPQGAGLRDPPREGEARCQITRQEVEAIGVEAVEDAESAPVSGGKVDHKASDGNAAHASPERAPRPGSKQALLVAILSKPKGATLGQLVEATGWLPHTTRAALTGLRKRGFAIERAADDKLGSVYRIVFERTQAAA